MLLLALALCNNFYLVWFVITAKKNQFFFHLKRNETFYCNLHYNCHSILYRCHYIWHPKLLIELTLSIKFSTEICPRAELFVTMKNCTAKKMNRNKWIERFSCYILWNKWWTLQPKRTMTKRKTCPSWHIMYLMGFCWQFLYRSIIISYYPWYWYNFSEKCDTYTHRQKLGKLPQLLNKINITQFSYVENIIIQQRIGFYLTEQI